MENTRFLLSRSDLDALGVMLRRSGQLCGTVAGTGQRQTLGSLNWELHNNNLIGSE